MPGSRTHRTFGGYRSLSHLKHLTDSLCRNFSSIALAPFSNPMSHHISILLQHPRGAGVGPPWLHSRRTIHFNLPLIVGIGIQIGCLFDAQDHISWPQPQCNTFRVGLASFVLPFYPHTDSASFWKAKWLPELQFGVDTIMRTQNSGMFSLDGGVIPLFTLLYIQSVVLSMAIKMFFVSLFRSLPKTRRSPRDDVRPRIEFKLRVNLRVPTRDVKTYRSRGRGAWDIGKRGSSSQTLFARMRD